MGRIGKLFAAVDVVRSPTNLLSTYAIFMLTSTKLCITSAVNKQLTIKASLTQQPICVSVCMQLSDYCRSDFIEAAQPGLQFYGALKNFMCSKNKWHLLNAIWQRRLYAYADRHGQKNHSRTEVMIDWLSLDTS
jgi:hypothetical protein